MAFDELAIDSAGRPVRRAPVPPSSARSATDAPPAADVGPLTTGHATQLQRAFGNRATADLIGRQLSRDATAVVQRAKPGRGAKSGQPVLPGRSSRRRLAEQDELAAMEQANLAWEAEHDDEEEDPNHNPFGILPIEDLEPAAAAPQLVPAGPTRPTFEAVVAAGSNVEKLRDVLVPFYGKEKAGHMSRILRSGNPRVTTIDGLERAAGVKAAEHAVRAEAPEPTSAPSGALNVHTGRPVGGLSKGTGKGFKAGVPAAWHVHHDHVKYATDGATRVDFPGRAAAVIAADVRTALTRTPDRTGYPACRRWMNKELGTGL